MTDEGSYKEVVWLRLMEVFMGRMDGKKKINFFF